jgi:hypothetical protein
VNRRRIERKRKNLKEEIQCKEYNGRLFLVKTQMKVSIRHQLVSAKIFDNWKRIMSGR